METDAVTSKSLMERMRGLRIGMYRPVMPQDSSYQATVRLHELHRGPAPRIHMDCLRGQA